MRDTGILPVPAPFARARRPCHGSSDMDFLNNWLLTILIFLPTVGAVLVLLPRDRETVRRLGVATTVVTFALSLLLFATFRWGLSGPYDYQQHPVGRTPGVVQMVNND